MGTPPFVQVHGGARPWHDYYTATSTNRWDCQALRGCTIDTSYMRTGARAMSEGGSLRTTSQSALC
eukprot:2800700-Lingulodinium_polyedra.AAC.1